MIALRPQQLDQRIETIEGAFRKLGVVGIKPTPHEANPRVIEIIVTHPGWPALPVAATVKFVEVWLFVGDLWRLVKYEYDLFFEPKKIGSRYGFHWHDGTYHRHCWDSRVPDRSHHFKGEPIDLFDAFNYFEMILAKDEGISCAGLRSAKG